MLDTVATASWPAQGELRLPIFEGGRRDRRFVALRRAALRAAPTTDVLVDCNATSRRYTPSRPSAGERRTTREAWPFHAAAQRAAGAALRCRPYEPPQRIRNGVRFPRLRTASPTLAAVRCGEPPRSWRRRCSRRSGDLRPLRAPAPRSARTRAGSASSSRAFRRAARHASSTSPRARPPSRSSCAHGRLLGRRP